MHGQGRLLLHRHGKFPSYNNAKPTFTLALPLRLLLPALTVNHPLGQTSMSASDLPRVANIPESSTTVDVRVIDTYGAWSLLTFWG